MKKKDSSLTVGEQKKLTELETTIENGMKSFIDVGRALIAIRDRKLFTDVHESFEGYCKKRWGFAKSRAYQFIEATKTVENLSTIVEIPPPENEAQARVLAEIEDANKQADVWTKAVETAPKDKDTGKPKVTAAHVAKVRDEVLGDKKPEPAKPQSSGDDSVDRDGCSDLSPQEAMAEWNRKVEAWAREMMAPFKNAPEGPWLDKSRLAIVEGQQKSAAASARQAKCDKICPLCDGVGCDRCHDTGFMPKRSYEMAGGK